MKREKYQKQIADRIIKLGTGSVFTATDFLDMAPTYAINESLHRMMLDGSIRRIMTGVYYAPKNSELFGEDLPPSISKIAEALSRKYNWTIAPSGDTALNMLHLSTQMPNTWTYVSDGPYKRYRIGRYELQFKNTKTRHISGYSRITNLMIQAIKAIGKDSVTEEQIRYLKSELSTEDKRTVLKEAQTTTRWIYEIVRTICREETE